MADGNISVSVRDLDEFKALEKVNQSVSDLVLGVNNTEFANNNFGIHGLYAALVVAHNEYERDFNTLKGPLK